MVCEGKYAASYRHFSCEEKDAPSIIDNAAVKRNMHRFIIDNTAMKRNMQLLL